jgi:hypothetical protein
MENQPQAREADSEYMDALNQQSHAGEQGEHEMDEPTYEKF